MMILKNCIFILLNFLILIVCNTPTEASDFPEDIVLCHYADSNCLKTTAQYVLKTYGMSGIPKFNISPIDPLRLDLLKIDRNRNSPLNIELKLENMDIYGLQKANIIKISGFDSDIKDLIEIKMRVPRVEIKSNYTIDGSILILPITGKGKSMVFLDDVLLQVKLHAVPIIKDNGIYMKVTSSRVEMTPKHAAFNLDNLFNGDKFLGENMNNFLNENWSDLYEELKPGLSVALGKSLKQLMNEQFSKITYQTLFEK